MANILAWLSGKKTYIIAVIILVLSILIGCFNITIPAWVWAGLAAIGLGFIKSAIPSNNVQLTGIAQNIFATKWGKYLVPALLAIGGALQFAGIQIPEFVWTALGAVGAGSLRANIEAAKTATDATTTTTAKV